MSSINQSIDPSFSDDTETFHVHKSDDTSSSTSLMDEDQSIIQSIDQSINQSDDMDIQSDRSTEPVQMIECSVQCNMYDEQAIDPMVQALESKKQRLLTEVTELISLRDDLKQSINLMSSFNGAEPATSQLTMAESARRVLQQDIARLANPQTYDRSRSPYRTSPVRLCPPSNTQILSRPVSPAMNRTMNTTITHDMSAQFRMSFKQRSPSIDRTTDKPEADQSIRSSIQAMFAQAASPIKPSGKRSGPIKAAPARPNSPTFISNTASSFIIPDSIDIDSSDNEEADRSINVPANSPTPGSPVSFVGSAKWPAPLRMTNPPIKQSLKQSIFDDSEQQWANTMIDTKNLFEGANPTSPSLNQSIKHAINMTQKQAALRSSLIDITNYRASPSSSPAQSPLRSTNHQSDVEKPRASQRSLFHQSQEDLLYE